MARGGAPLLERIGALIAQRLVPQSVHTAIIPRLYGTPLCHLTSMSLFLAGDGICELVSSQPCHELFQAEDPDCLRRPRALLVLATEANMMLGGLTRDTAPVNVIGQIATRPDVNRDCNSRVLLWGKGRK